MNDFSRVSNSGSQAYSGLTQTGAMDALISKGLTNTIANFQQPPPTLTHGNSSSNDSLITNANGAPQLGAITLNFSPEDLAAALSVLQGKTQDAQMATAKEGLNTNSKKIEDQKQRNLDKIKEWTDKCKSADAKAKAGGILGWFKKIFTVVAAVFAVAAATIVTGVSAGAGAALLALAVLGLASAVTGLASDIAKATGHKGFDHVLQWMDPAALFGKGMSELAKAFGANETQAAIVATTFAIAGTIAILIASVALSGGSNVSSSIEKLSQATQKMVGLALNVSRVGQSVAGVAGGVTDVAQGSVNIVVAQDRRDASNIQADKKNIDAVIAKLQQQMEGDREDIKKVMDEIMEGMNIVSQMITSAHENRSQISARMTGKGMTI